MDEDQLFLTPADLAPHDESRPCGGDLESIIGQVARLRQDLFRIALIGMLGGAGLVQSLAFIFR
jgi:hypothetical protein